MNHIDQNISNDSSNESSGRYNSHNCKSRVNGNNNLYNNRLGRIGENDVAVFLAGRGHTILERNWRSGHLEIDIITMDEGGLHFVEVKSRNSNEDVLPEDSIGPTKMKRIAAAAQKYLKSRKIEDMECHFDTASVIFNKFGGEVRYICDAYIPMFF